LKEHFSIVDYQSGICRPRNRRKNNSQSWIANPVFATVPSLEIIEKVILDRGLLIRFHPVNFTAPASTASASAPEFKLPSAFSVTLPHISREARRQFMATAANLRNQDGHEPPKKTVTAVKMR
jgi:hypothetical protein